MNWLQLILGIVPSIPYFVHSVETLVGPGNGAQKKQAVQQLVAASLQSLQVTEQVAPHSADTIDKLTPAIGTLIDGVVGIFNKTGVFKNPASLADPRPPSPVRTDAPQAAGASVASL